MDSYRVSNGCQRVSNVNAKRKEKEYLRTPHIRSVNQVFPHGLAEKTG